MKFDIAGRINNMSLPDGKTAILYSVFEAVSNSLHAIEDRFDPKELGKKGRVAIEITTNDDISIQSIIISDNGTGFRPENVEAFETSDSRFKYVRGGKGVGRFVWIKVFGSIRVLSRYKTASSSRSLAFDFLPEAAKSIRKKTITVPAELNPGSRVILSQIKEGQSEKIKRISFMRDLALHFFPYFIAGSMPRIDIIYNKKSESLNDFIKSKISEPVTQLIKVKIDGAVHPLEMDHVYVDPTISKKLRNSILLTAHRRLVGEPISIERRYSLKQLPEGKAYVGVVRGSYLDARVDQERLSLRLTREQMKQLQSALLTEAEKFLTKHVAKLRAGQKKVVRDLLAEHPQLAIKVGDINKYVLGLYPGMGEEEIGQNLFVLLYRDEQKITSKIAKFSELESLDNAAKQEAESVLGKVTDQAKHRLAELVVKRRQVLTIARSLLKYKDDDKKSYHYERVVHDLICPVGQMYESKDYRSHNLWIIDDLLAFYSFFASDKSIASLAPGSKSKKEPDLIFFNPLGFRREGSNDPVAVIEFKRPGDEHPSKDPIDQVLEYIEELRGATVKSVDGEVIAEITANTPFECYVICELTKATRKLLSRSQAAHETPDGQGYYGWAPNHKAVVHVISFQKMLKDAELRHKVFFEKLGLFPTGL